MKFIHNLKVEEVQADGHRKVEEVNINYFVRIKFLKQQSINWKSKEVDMEVDMAVDLVVAMAEEAQLQSLKSSKSFKHQVVAAMVSFTEIKKFLNQ